MGYEQQFLYALVETIIIETIVVFVVAYWVYKLRRIKDILFCGFITSALTLPYFWFIFPFFFSYHTSSIVIAEVCITCIEAVVYWWILDLSFKQALTISFLANGASVGVGLLL